jgi:hypothetical protein
MFDEDKEKVIAWEKFVERNIAIAETKAKGCGTPNYCAKRGCVNKIIDQECKRQSLYRFSAIEIKEGIAPQSLTATLIPTPEDLFAEQIKTQAEQIDKWLTECFGKFYCGWRWRLYKVRLAAQSGLRNLASKFRRKGRGYPWRRGSTRHGKK